ncbi:MAG: helix-turn-helix transcriptional regulator [Myxococcales bacterium]
MVGIGHGIARIPFRNRARPGSDVEVLRLSTIVRRAPPEQLAQPERPEFHLVALFVAGQCTHSIDFAEHRCRPGTLLYVRPGQVQRWDVQPGLEALVLLFTSAFLFPDRPRTGALWHERFFDDVAWPAALDLPEADHQAMKAWLLQLESTYRALDATAVSSALMRHLVSAALLDLARRRNLSPEPPAVVPAHLARARQFRADVERSFRVTRRVLDYAERLGCSAKTLDRCCQEILGQSAKEYVDARVALEAKRMLAHTTLAVAAIGEALGFTEATNFVKFFKAREGMPPGDFRSRQARR